MFGNEKSLEERKTQVMDNQSKNKYTDEQVARLRETPMRDILAAEGFDTSHTRGGLYFSPFRTKERTPSLHIDDANHRWYDHGVPDTGIGGKRGGDTIAFVMVLKNYSVGQALNYLCRFNPQIVPMRNIRPITVPRGGDRIIADGFAWANTELRIKLFKFLLLGQDFYLATNPFFDFGVITKPYRLERHGRSLPAQPHLQLLLLIITSARCVPKRRTQRAKTL